MQFRTEVFSFTFLKKVGRFTKFINNTSDRISEDDIHGR